MVKVPSCMVATDLPDRRVDQRSLRSPFVICDVARGVRGVTDEIELWEGRPNRLHHRIRYRRTADGWRAELLWP